MRQHFISRAEAMDRWLSRASMRMLGEGGALLAILLHHVLEKAELALDQVHPHERTTPEQLRRCIEHILEHGYTFVGTDDLLAGLQPGSRHALLTFDDGYYSNSRLLPILREYQAPVVVFVSTTPVEDNRAYWWDVVYRNRTAQRASEGSVSAELVTLSTWTHDRIDAYLLDQFGPHALHPVGDLDRPFSPAELKEFAADRLVYVENHTWHHARLPAYDAESAYCEIARAQESIAAMTGRVPQAIAFPYGHYSRQTIAAARQAGLRLGVTTMPRKNPLPVEPGSQGAFLLGRFTLWGHEDVDAQCEQWRSDVHLMATLRRARRRLLPRRQPD